MTDQNNKAQKVNSPNSLDMIQDSYDISSNNARENLTDAYAISRYSGLRKHYTLLNQLIKQYAMSKTIEEDEDSYFLYDLEWQINDWLSTELRFSTYTQKTKQTLKNEFLAFLSGIERPLTQDEKDLSLAKAILVEVVLGKENEFDPKKEKIDFKCELITCTVREVKNYAQNLSNNICGDDTYEETMIDWVYRKIFELKATDKTLLENNTEAVKTYTKQVKSDIQAARKHIETKVGIPIPRKIQIVSTPVPPRQISAETIIIKEAPPPPPPRRRQRQ